MSKALKRSIKTSQISLRQMTVRIDTPAAVPAAGGPDKFEIKQVVDLGVGSYTLILRNPSQSGKALIPVGFIGLEADTAVSVTAVAYDRITIQVSTLAGVAKDAVAALTFLVHDARYEV